MANTFFHQPNGTILIVDFTLTLAEFLEHVDPSYALPSPHTVREYRPDSGIHRLTNGFSFEAGPLPWTEGDAYIADVATIQATVEAARAAAEPPGDTPAEAAEAFVANEYIEGMVKGIAAAVLAGNADDPALLRAAIVDAIETELTP